jgi:hypothetical protein
VSAERVALIPQCEECRKVWLPAEGTGGWPTGSTTALKDRLAFWCSECAEHEFGE